MKPQPFSSLYDFTLPSKRPLALKTFGCRPGVLYIGCKPGVFCIMLVHTAHRAKHRSASEGRPQAKTVSRLAVQPAVLSARPDVQPAVFHEPSFQELPKTKHVIFANQSRFSPNLHSLTDTNHECIVERACGRCNRRQNGQSSLSRRMHCEISV